MKSNQNSARTLILVLLCILFILSLSLCLVFLINVGSFSADALFAGNSPTGSSALIVKSEPTSSGVFSPEVQFPYIPHLPENTPAATLYPDVSVPIASPNAGYSLTNSTDVFASFDTPADIVEYVKDGVVAIRNFHFNTKSGKFFAYGTSSGFIVSDHGYILTNAHAVYDAKKIEITLSDQTTVEAELVGYDLTTDIAVIKIPESYVKCVLILGDSDSIRVGEYVLAIGNPIGSENLYGTVSLGIVSGKNRAVNIDGFVNSFIQTDAALNPGNSGGPLLDMKGRVVGMNTAKAISAGYDNYGNAISSEGIGFSLPINDVIIIANSIIQNGGVIRPGIGITVYTLTAEDAISSDLVEGVYVDTVNAGSPAENAGLKRGDVIVSCNGEPIKDKDSLITVVKSAPLGSTIEATVYRAGKYLTFTITIGNMNEFNH